MRSSYLARGALLGALAFALPGTAGADFGLATSLGSGMLPRGSGQLEPLSLEVIPFGRIGFVTADLGITMNLQAPRLLRLRPGFRIDIEYLYLRTAIPLQLTGAFDYGALVGVGKLFGGDGVGLFIEANVRLTREFGFAGLPLEFRLGMQFDF